MEQISNNNERHSMDLPDSSTQLKKVKIYTDGGCDPNPGPGGYGVVLLLGDYKKELSGGYKLTTNNRMEIMAVIIGLEALKYTCQVEIFSDSQYVVNAINEGWAKKWSENNWFRNKKEKAENSDLWQKLLILIEEHHVTFEWVRGHAGNQFNERCDQLATKALKQPNLLKDEYYENLANSVPEGNSASVNKITKEGQPCRKCNVPVIKKIPKRKALRPGQNFYYEYYLICPRCDTMFFIEDAKIEVQSSSLFDHE